MNEKPYLSIIVPIYRVEQYLYKCLNSVLMQNVDDYEVLMIDDGSDDKSSEIMEWFTRLSKRFKSFHKENGGLSSARNLGISKACGEYVLFLDGDDYYSCDFFGELISDLKKEIPDVLLFNGEKEKNSKISRVRKKFATKNYKDGKEYISESIASFEWISMVWLGAYKREFIEQNNIIFKNGRIHEDDFFSVEVLMNARKIITKDEYWHHYNIHEGSIMKTKSNIDSFTSFCEVSLFIVNCELCKQNDALIWVLRRYMLSAYKHFYCLNINDRKNLLDKLEQLSRSAHIYLKDGERELARANNYFLDMQSIAQEKWYDHISKYNT